MMFSTKAEYGVRVMAHLAVANPGPEALELRYVGFSHMVGASVLFVVFYTLAILYRRIAPIHGRFMLCTALPFLDAAVEDVQVCRRGHGGPPPCGASTLRRTRGAHIRSDFPRLGADMAVNFTIQRDSDAQMHLQPTPIPAASAELDPWLSQSGDLEAREKLLE
jgi:hypothetical protein